MLECLCCGDPIYSTALGLLAYGCKSVAKPYTVTTSPETTEPEDSDAGPDKPGGFFERVTDGLNKIANTMWGSLTDNSDEGGVD